MTDPIDDIENSDDSEVECCRHCRELIDLGTEIEWNGYFWHFDCVPSHVLAGIEQQARNDEKDNK